MSNERSVSVSRQITAEPAEIFAIVADASRHAEFDGSGTVRGTRGDDPQPLALGDRFGMKMRLGVPYFMHSTVVEFEQDRLIAWAHFGKHRWRYTFEPNEDGTLVTETFDWSTALSPRFIEAVGYPERHRGSMEKTLERLEGLVTAG
ncbi:MAG: SRPBCC family protein [Actinomycetota bacterium]